MQLLNEMRSGIGSSSTKMAGASVGKEGMHLYLDLGGSFLSLNPFRHRSCDRMDFCSESVFLFLPDSNSGIA